MKKILPILLLVISAILIAIFFSYRITETPPGLTVDEAAFAYNAVLLEKTGHDENYRFTPVFVSSIGGADWRQPVSQYYITAVFKIFGPSVLVLRLSTVAVMLLSVFLIYFWLTKIHSVKAGMVGSLIFLTTPIIMIQTHMALDNIFPVPFTIAWLIFLWYYSDSKKYKYLVLAGISLGICFYTYKAMRATVPVWCILTVLYLFNDLRGKYSKKNILGFLKTSLSFTLGVLPFFAVIPLLEQKYPGAVFNSQGFNWSTIYNFIYPYLSSFDLSFLFIKGDETVYHSTGIHGMVLLSSLPFFLTGLYLSIKKKGIWTFLMLVMFTTPLLFGFVGSVHRASRLMAFLPAYVAISTLGVMAVLELKNKTLSRFLLIVTVLAFSANFYDFVNYYWYPYPKLVRTDFLPSNTVEGAYKFLSKVAKKNNLTAYVDSGARNSDGQTGNFLESAYFDIPLKSWQPGDPLPKKSIVMTKVQQQPNLKSIGSPIYEYRFLVNEEETIIGL